MTGREAATSWARSRSYTYGQPTRLRVERLRCDHVLATTPLITLFASDAATAHRFKPPARAHQRISVRPSQHVIVPTFTVPGSTDEQTREWLDNAERGSHEG